LAAAETYGVAGSSAVTFFVGMMFGIYSIGRVAFSIMKRQLYFYINAEIKVKKEYSINA
jgi:hypothetical protein